MSQGHFELDMCHGPLGGKIIRFTLPLMASSMIQLLFNAADVIVVGKFAGDTSLAAVTSTGSLVNLLVNLFVGLSIGANVTAAQALGHGDTGRVERTVHSSILLSLISGVFLALFGVAAAGQLLEWMSCPGNVIGLSSLYLRIYFLGMPALMLYNFGSALLRSGGDTQRPLRFLSIAGAVNVGLNLLLVIVFRLDVAGVAIATVISQYISATLVLRCLMGETGPLHLDLKALRMEKDVVANIVRVGLPAGFQGILFSLSNVVIQSSVNSFGDTVMAGSGASANVEGFLHAGVNAFHQTCLTFIGQNYGAGKLKRTDRVLLWCLGYAVATALVLGLGSYLLAPWLLGIYSPNPAVIEQGMLRAGFICAPYFIYAIMDVMVGTLRGLGASAVPMAVSVVGICGLRLVWIATVFQAVRTPQCLYFSYPVTWAITGACHVLCFLVLRRRIRARRVAPLAETAG